MGKLKPVDMTPYIGRVVVAEINMDEDTGTLCSLIVPHRRDVGDPEFTAFHWAESPSWSIARFVKGRNPLGRGEARILVDCGPEPDEDADQWWDKTTLNFLKTYQRVEPDTIDAMALCDIGWIAPNGSYYPVEYGDHDGLARVLVACEYDRLLDGYHARDFLMENGWLCVASISVAEGRDRYLIGGQMNQAQARALRGIVDRVPQAEAWLARYDKKGGSDDNNT